MTDNQSQISVDQLRTKYEALFTSPFKDKPSTVLQRMLLHLTEKDAADQGYTPFAEPLWETLERASLADDQPKKKVARKKKGDETQPQDDDAAAPAAPAADKRMLIVTLGTAVKTTPNWLLACLVHECLNAQKTISTDKIHDDGDIKQCIIDTATKSGWGVAQVVFRIADKYSDEHLRDYIAETPLNFRVHLLTAVTDYIKNDSIRELIVATYVKVLKVFAMYLETQRWNDVKIVDDTPVAQKYSVVPNDLVTFLHYENKQLDRQFRLEPFLLGQQVIQFTKLVTPVKKVKTDEEKAADEETKQKKAAEKAAKAAAGKSATASDTEASDSEKTEADDAKDDDKPVDKPAKEEKKADDAKKLTPAQKAAATKAANKKAADEKAAAAKAAGSPKAADTEMKTEDAPAPVTPAAAPKAAGRYQRPGRT